MLEALDRRWAVVGFDYDRAAVIIDDIQAKCGKEVLRRVRNRLQQHVEFVDGTILEWVKASENSRGRKFGRMWCDKAINREVFNRIIRPCYYGSQEDIIWLQ